MTGLFGQGEGACIEQLQRQFPWFDRDREDEENAAAAARLGLAGGPKNWVWENWLAIEAERGLPVTCYLCALESIVAGEQYQVAPTDPDDIRLIVGSFGSNELVFRVAARHGFEMWAMQYIAANDYQLRAVAWTVNAGRHVNAEELQSIYDLIGEAVAAGQLPGQLVWRTAVAQGGYAPTPSQAAFEDQVFLLATPLEAQALGMNPIIASGMLRTFNTFVVAEWASERAKGSMRGLGEFIQDNYSASLGLD